MEQLAEYFFALFELAVKEQNSEGFRYFYQNYDREDGSDYSEVNLRNPPVLELESIGSKDGKKFPYYRNETDKQ